MRISDWSSDVCSSDLKAAYQSFIEAFNQEHPDIEVRFEAFEAQNYATILSTALAAEQGPDVMMVRAYGAFQAVAEPGYLMAIDQSTVPELKNFPADAPAAEQLPPDETGSAREGKESVRTSSDRSSLAH